MFAERCARCFALGDRVRLFDVIYDGKADLLCERCAIIENIPIIMKPEDSKIIEADKPASVYDRMKRLAGINGFSEHKESIRGERLKELENNPILQMPIKKKPEMIEYFHWEIMRHRRRRGYTQEKLAEVLEVPIEDIDLLEKGEIIDNIDTINKIQRFFNIRIIKKNPFERHEERVVLLDEYGHELDHIPEPDTNEDKFSEDNYTNDLIMEGKEDDYDISKADPEKVSLRDLMELHKRRVLATKEEQKQEQKKIEAKQKIIEARKEELRMIREKESRELDNILGGSELISKKEEGSSKIDRLFDEAMGDDTPN